MSDMESQDTTQEVQLTEESEIAVDDDQKPVFNRIQMADVIRREKQKAYEKGRRDSMQEQRPQDVQPQPQVAQPAQNQPAPQTLGGMPAMTPDQVRQMVADETSRTMQSQAQAFSAQRTADSFVQKMRAAEQHYPGLEAKLNELDYTHMGDLIRHVNDMENPGEIMKELVIDNPLKMGNLVALFHTQPKLAQKALYDLSNSIKQNMTAQAQEAEVSDPLSPIKPSNVAMDSGSKGSIRDFKNKYRG